MVEVAVGADILTIKEAIEFDKHVHTKEDFMISSCCCPIWVAALKRVYHDLIEEVSPSVSPMIATARMIKHMNPNTKVVFVGPCIAKKQEVKEPDLIGGVAQAVWETVDHLFPEKRELFTSLQVDGMKDCKDILTQLEQGEKRASFIEGMACKGGCAGGPKKIVEVAEGIEAVNQFANESAVKVPFHSEVLNELMYQIGIHGINDLANGHSMFERTFER